MVEPIKGWAPDEVTPPAPAVAADEARGWRPDEIGPPANKPTTQPQGIARNLTAGINETLAGIAGAPADLGAWLIAPPLWGKLSEGDRQKFREENPKQAAVFDFLKNVSDHPSLGKDWWQEVMSSGGIKTSEVQPTSAAERIARGTGQGIGSMMVPGLGIAPKAGGALSALRSGVSNVIVGAGMGAGGAAAKEYAPEEMKPAAELLGGLVGGVGASIADVGAGIASARTVGDAITSAFRAVAEPPKLTAARTLKSRATDAQAFRRELANQEGVPTLVAGSEPTTFQATGDRGIGALERENAQGSPYGVERFAARREEQNAARQTAIRSVSDPQADANNVTNYIRSRLDDLTGAHAERVGQAARNVAGRLSEAGGVGFDNPAAYGEALRDPLAALHQGAKDEASALWRAIDPDLSMPVNVRALRESTGDLTSKIPATAKPPSGEEASIFDTIGKLGETPSFGEIVALRSRVTDAIRDERRSGTPTALRRLSITLDNIDNTLAQTAGDIASDPQRAPGLFQRLQSEVDAWQSRRANEGTAVQAGGIAREGVVGAVPVGARDIPPAFGGEGQTGGGLGVPARDQSLQEPAGIPLDVAERYGAARDATREMKGTFERGPVGQVLRPDAERGSFRMPASRVATNLFDSPEKLGAFVKAAGEDAGLTTTMRDYAAFSMRQAAVKDGTISPQNLQKWTDNHRYVFDQFPGLEGRFANAREAQATLDDAMARQKGDLQDFQKSAAQHFLTGQTPEQAVAKAIKNPEEFRSVVDLVKNDPDALAGLKRATVDYLMAVGRGTSTAEAGTSGLSAINAATLQKDLINNRQSLNALFSKEEIANMDNVAADLQRANRSIVALKMPGGSNTAQDTAGRFTTAFQQIASRGLGSVLGAVAGGTAGAHFGMGTMGTAVGALSGATMDAMRAARAESVQRAVTDMLLDRRMTLAWLDRIPQSAGEGWQQGFARRLRSATAASVVDSVNGR